MRLKQGRAEKFEAFLKIELFIQFFRVIQVTSEEFAEIAEKVRRDPTFKGVVGRSLSRIHYLNKIESNHEPFNVAKEVFVTFSVVVFTRKNFFLIRALNEKIETMKAAGLVEFWYYQHVDKRPLQAKDTKQPRALTTQNMIGCFHILIFGWILSLTAFVVERLINYLRIRALV